MENLPPSPSPCFLLIYIYLCETGSHVALTGLKLYNCEWSRALDSPVSGIRLQAGVAIPGVWHHSRALCVRGQRSNNGATPPVSCSCSLKDKTAKTEVGRDKSRYTMPGSGLL